MLIPDLIGMELQWARQLIPETVKITVVETLTPYDDKRLERADQPPIVMRQKCEGHNIELTISYFK